MHLHDTRWNSGVVDAGCGWYKPLYMLMKYMDQSTYEQNTTGANRSGVEYTSSDNLRENIISYKKL